MPLELSDVNHSFSRDRPVLHDLNLTINDGDSVAITGPSGSGKTTLLSIMGLLLVPSQGSLRVDGVTVPSSRSKRASLRTAKFGWTFQTMNVLHSRTVLDNTSLSTLSKGHTRASADLASRAALSGVGLGDRWHSRASELSGGEIQRLCVARAYASNPQFLMADEPTGQLDATTTELVIDSLFSARPARTAIVFATHDPTVADRCARVLELKDGGVCE